MDHSDEANKSPLGPYNGRFGLDWGTWVLNAYFRETKLTGKPPRGANKEWYVRASFLHCLPRRSTGNAGFRTGFLI